jgi:hypothetical protein
MLLEYCVFVQFNQIIHGMKNYLYMYIKNKLMKRDASTSRRCNIVI